MRYFRNANIPAPPIWQFRQLRTECQPARVPCTFLPVFWGLFAFGFVLGELLGLPAFFSLGADAEEEFAGWLVDGIGGSPFGSQLAAEGRPQHTLTKLTDQRPDFRKQIPRSRTSLLKRLDR